jgi:hypothetical protein
LGSIRYAGAGGFILAALVFFGLAISSFYRSDRDARLATTQKTATATGFQTYSTSFSSGNSSGYFHRHYQFTVDNMLYVGSGCPNFTLAQNLRDGLLKELGTRQFKATVYYDPSDPSTNSLSAYTANDSNVMGIWFICLGVCSLGLVLMGMLMAGPQQSLEPAAAATNEPTSLPPDYVPSDQKFLEDLDKALRSKEPPDHT